MPFVSVCCDGERCSLCGQFAEHKVEETIFPDDPFRGRHPFTAYICHSHFRQIMGKAVDGYRKWEDEMAANKNSETLTKIQRDVIRLIGRSTPTADGWYSVSAVLWGMVKLNLTADLAVKEETASGGRIRLTPKGQAVLLAIA